MPITIDPIENGESGASVRAKINALIAGAGAGELGIITQEDLDAIVDTTAPATPFGLELEFVLLPTPKIVATWNFNDENDFLFYDLQWREGTGPWISHSGLSSTTDELLNVKPVTDYSARIRAVDKAGNASAFSAIVSVTTAKDNIPPATPIGLQIDSGLSVFWLKWTPNTETDLYDYEVYESETDDAPAADVTNYFESPAASFARAGLAAGEQRYYWVRAVDTSGNKSAWSASVNGTTGTIPEAVDVTVDSVLFTPGQNGGNRLTWSAGQIAYGVPGATPTVQTISAGYVDWSSGKVYVYYVKGNTALSTTTNLVTVYASSGIVVGIYSGGAGGFQLVSGKAMLDGGSLIAQTVGANALVTDQAVITGSAQIADAIITSAKVLSLSAAKIEGGTALLGSVTVNSRALSSVATDNVFDDMSNQNMSGAGPGTLSWVNADASTGKYYGSVVGIVTLTGNDYYPFDKNKLYKITVRVRSADANPGVGVFYSSFLSYDKNKALLGTFTHIYWSNEIAFAGAGWVDVVGYLKGTSPAGTNVNGSTVANPAKAVDGTAFIQPRLFVNNTGSGEMQIDSWRMEVVGTDAAAVVNAGATLIEPGLVKISGSTTIADWRFGGDNTKINGGVVAANTLLANSGVFGLRGITPDGLTFQHNSPSTNYVSWTAGTLTYTNDAGSTVTQAISAANAQWTTGTLYIYYTQGATALATTTNATTANDKNNVILATYKGGTNLVANYGRTIIDGSGITAVMAAFDTAAINTMRSNILVSNVIIGTMVQANTLSGRHLVLSDTTNLVPDNQFMDDSAWVISGLPAAAWTSANAPSDTWKSKRIFKWLVANKGTAFAGRVSQNFPVKVGAKYLASIQAQRQTGTVAQVYVRVMWFNSTGTNIGFGNVIANTTSFSLLTEVELTPPSGASYAQFQFYVQQDNSDGDVIFAAPLVKEKDAASLLVDGSVTASKLNITGGLSDLSPNLGSMTSGALNINNRFIVLADGTTTIRSATSGARLEMTSNYILLVDDT